MTDEDAAVAAAMRLGEVPAVERDRSGYRLRVAGVVVGRVSQNRDGHWFPGRWVTPHFALAQAFHAASVAVGVSAPGSTFRAVLADAFLSQVLLADVAGTISGRCPADDEQP